MPARHILALCYGASGAAALVYQVAWVRLFTLTLGPTVAASSTVLAAFMGGLALGAWVIGRSPIPPSRSLPVYAALESLLGIIALALPAIFSAFEPLIAAAYADGTAPALFAITRVAVSLAVLGLPATAMGATYPLAVSWLAHCGTQQTEERLRAAASGG